VKYGRKAFGLTFLEAILDGIGLSLKEISKLALSEKF
jgi:hypothetical protein